MKRTTLAALLFLLLPGAAGAQSGFAIVRCFGANVSFDCGDNSNNALRVSLVASTPTLTINLPSGASTAANQTTMIGHVDGLEGLLGGTLTVGTHAVTQSGAWSVSGTGTFTVDSELPAAGALADNTANPTVPGVGAFQLIWDGANWDRSPGNSTDGTLVNLGANNDVTVTGTVTANAGTNLNTSALLTTTAHDNAFGTAGTADAQVRTIQGIASMTPVQVSQATAANLNATVTDGTGPLTVDGTVAATQSGTWTVQPGNTANTTPWLASINEGGVTADVFDLTNSNPLATQIVDGAGTAITSFGGGTQYTEADTDASITGTALLWEDTSDTLRSVSAAKPLPVNIISGAGSGGTAIQDGAVFTPDTTNLTPIGGYRDDAAPATVTEGDAAAARITENRALHVNLRDATGAELAVGGGTQYDQGTATTATDKLTMSGAIRRDSAALDAGVADGDRAALSTDSAGRLRTTSADTTQPVSGTVTANAGSGTFTVGDGSGALNVIVDSSALPTGASTLAEQQTQTTALQLLDNVVRNEDDASGDTHAGAVILAKRDDTPGNTSGTDGDYEPLQVSGGRLWSSATIDAALPAGNANIGDVDVATLPALVAGTANIGDVDVATIAAGDTDIGNVDLEFAGTAASTGVGASGAQTLRTASLIHDGTDTALVSAAGSLNVDVVTLPNEGQQTAASSISVTPDTDNDAVGAAGAAPPGEYVAVAGVTSGATGGFLGGIPVCTEFFSVDIVTATTTLAITGVSGRHVYICSINLVSAGANNVALIAGTGATCGTSTAGINGGVTAAEGWNFAANGGIAQGTGLGAIMTTQVAGGATGDSVCIITSAAAQLSGTIGFAIY